MRDLNRHIVEQQAAQWERLGLEFGLNDYHIANISKDNPNRSVTCCRVMLQKWLDIDPSATWAKLYDAIKKIKLSSTTTVVWEKFMVRNIREKKIRGKKFSSMQAIDENFLTPNISYMHILTCTLNYHSLFFLS